MPFGGLLTVGLISAAGAGVSAGIQANAAGSAADQQKAASADALAFQKQQWQQTQANEAPFLQAGQGAVKRLSQWMDPTATNMPPGSASVQATGRTPTPSYVMGTNPSGGVNVPRGTPQSVVPGASTVPTGGMSTQTQPGGVQAPDPMNQPQQGRSAYLVQAPGKGAVQMIPAQYLQHYVGLGATVVA